MNATERRKAIEDAVALAAVNPLVPASVRVGIAALAEEMRELAVRVSLLEMASVAGAAAVNSRGKNGG